MPDLATRTVPASQGYICRRCSFDLGGLALTEGRLTCPECGNTGVLQEVAEPEPLPLPPMWKRILDMCLPTTVLTAVAFAVAGITPSDSVVAGLFMALFGGAAVVSGLVYPFAVARELTLRHVRAKRRSRAMLVLASVGLIFNIMQLPITFMVTSLFIHRLSR